MQQPFCPRLVGLVAAATLLAGGGCATYRPEPLEAGRELGLLRDRDLAAHFVVERARPGQDPGSTSLPTPASGAFDPADGLDEAETVAVALTLNPGLRAKRAGTGEAQAALITAGLWPNPEVGLGVRPGIDGTSGTTVEADALFQLLWPGERDARKRAAAAGVDETRAEVIAAEFELAGRVREQRLAVLAADRTVALLREAVDLRRRARDLVRRQRQIGEASEMATSVTEFELAEAERDLRQARVELGSERRALNALLGLPPDYDLRLTGLGEPLAVTVFEDVTDDELDRRVLAGRVELRGGEAAYRRAEQELRLAVLRQYPRLGVGPGYEREPDGNQLLGLALSLELPLFDRNQGEIAGKRAARERARAEYAALLHRLRADAFAARAAVRAAKAEVEAQERDVLPLIRRHQDLVEGAYRAREVGITDWLVAQQRAVEARREYLEALVRYRRSVIQLETAAGRPLSSPATATAPANAPTTAPATQPQ